MVNLATVAPVGKLPVGEMVELPGRGSTYVVDTGDTGASGPPLILLHAMACTGLLTWYPVLGDLAKRGRVVVFDQRWHGRGIRSARFSLDDCADDVVAVADELGIDKFVVVGYSLGSLVSQLAWKRHPDRVAGMVLCASTTTFRELPRERLILEGMSRAVGRLHLRPSRVSTDEITDPTGDRKWALGQFRQTSYGAISRATAEVGKFDSSQWIADVDVPTAVVVTARDKAVPPRRQHFIAQQIRNATAYEVDCGHASCVMAADEFRSGLLPACASVTSRVPR
ncbi:alpha/beta fold hydrolase [Antrihabitans sp. YC2-6]|uniref:alpha/beta fold hydrolase n=1 Tax=Antrihabitans sp. YC2-6 TaxID=2799498 RepID=UPI0018F4E02B|nr:alpha/beta hydrolase [Antrihabitans sp. YC2-6]MBJ8345089.1 alpha/beta hydrolase [Antrihabitans sp. YC2-6]